MYVNRQIGNWKLAYRKSAYWHIGILTVVLLYCAMCTPRTYTPTRTRDFSVQSTKDRTRPLPRYVVHNINDSVSRLYFAIKSSDLLYQRSNVNNEMYANFKVEFTIHPTNSPKSITDTGYVIQNNIPQSSGEWIYGYSDFDIPSYDGEYFMDVILRDLNKMTTAYDLLYLSHTGRDAATNFILMEPNSTTPLYSNSIGPNQEFTIQYVEPTITKIFVHYSPNSADAARPPYSITVPPQVAQKDSTWIIDLVQHPILKFSNEGRYRFTVEPGSKEGLMVTRFRSDYPKLTTPIALLEPLRYITTKKEYTTLENSPHMKVSIDSFWIKAGGSQERARELISAYYGRVEIVNTHFSTYKEGWKTDRGMIYIIYGEPQNVYRMADRETWAYGTDQSGNTLNFVFNRNSTSGYPNDFELERNSVYNVSWITAVDYWKQGQVYRAR